MDAAQPHHSGTRHTECMSSVMTTRAPGRSTSLSRRASSLPGAVIVIGALLALMWLLEGIDQVTGHALDSLGITTRDPGDLWSIGTAPFIHFGWAHLEANSIPFFLLGVIVLLGGLWRWLTATVIPTLTSGLSAWLLSAPHTVTAGASGLIFGWLTYVLARGIFSRNWRHIVVGLVVLAIYGSVLWGVLPEATGISWQAHLGGAVGGVLAAWVVERRARRRVI